ncbi:MAG: DsrE family protein [Halofilum sp. (in: g-proteobacteria)]|nr:DsrE family protein [Halofilum sp. (in: g-proteobacteria)]
MMLPRAIKPVSTVGRALGGFVAPVVFIVVLTLTGAVVSARLAAAQDEFGGGPAKVVYHADFKDPRRFSSMLTSIYNMASTYQNELRDYDVRIVFNSYGIRFLTDDPLDGTPFEIDAALQERREDLKGRLRSLQTAYDVKLELCDITRRQVGLSRDKVYEGVESVESGVVQVAELQSKGFAYIKIE